MALKRISLVLVGLTLTFTASAQAATVSHDFSAGEAAFTDFDAQPGETNRVTMTRVGKGVRFVDAGAPLKVGEGCVQETPNQVLCRRVATDGSITISLGDGDDTATLRDGGLSRDEAVLVHGGDGRDTIMGGNHGERLSGGAGDDTLRGGGGNDELAGDAGNDLLDGGDGVDALRFDDVEFANPLKLDLLTPGPGGFGGERDRWLDVEGVLSNTDGESDLRGTHTRDFFRISGGPASIESLEGNDRVESEGLGKLRLDLGEGNDRGVLESFAAGSSVSCGSGSDSLHLSAPALIAVGSDCERITTSDPNFIDDRFLTFRMPLRRQSLIVRCLRFRVKQTCGIEIAIEDARTGRSLAHASATLRQDQTRTVRLNRPLPVGKPVVMHVELSGKWFYDVGERPKVNFRTTVR